jgi:hypothetical protein
LEAQRPKEQQRTEDRRTLREIENVEEQPDVERPFWTWTASWAEQDGDRAKFGRGKCLRKNNLDKLLLSNVG